jgi:histidinol phosphatase-like PHP family hydrolase
MLDGAARLDELVSKAVEDGQPALGITDHGNMYVESRALSQSLAPRPTWRTTIAQNVLRVGVA